MPTMEPEVMRDRFAAARVARLGTVDAAGRPHLVPCAFVLEGDTAYSAVDAKPKTTLDLARVRNVERHPAAALLVDEYDDDWSRLWWVRVRGGARVLRDGPERHQALAALAAKYAQYRATPPPGPVLALDVAEWLGWSAG